MDVTNPTYVERVLSLLVVELQGCRHLELEVAGLWVEETAKYVANAIQTGCVGDYNFDHAAGHALRMWENEQWIKEMKFQQAKRNCAACKALETSGMSDHRCSPDWWCNESQKELMREKCGDCRKLREINSAHTCHDLNAL